MTPTSAPVFQACSTDLLAPTFPASLPVPATAPDPRCSLPGQLTAAARHHAQAACCVQAAGWQRPQLQAAISVRRIRAQLKLHRGSYTWWDSCGGSRCPPGTRSHRIPLPLPATGATSGGLEPRAHQGSKPPASCTCPGSTQRTTAGSALLLEQLVLMLCGDTSAQ